MKLAQDQRDIKFFKSFISYFEENVHASDEISLSYEDDCAIQDLWSNGLTSKEGAHYYVPCDLFMSNQIPLPNVKFSIDERGLNNGRVVRFEVLLLPADLRALMKRVALVTDNAYPVGIVIVNDHRIQAIVPFFLIDGVDTVALHKCILLNKTVCEVEDSDKETMKSIISMLSTWYGVQIALLSPQIKTCFRRVQSEEHTSDQVENRKHQKRKAEYIKKIYVKRGEIRRRIENHKRRHTLSWYVIGHWRHYKDGKTIFVNGYWKGILKDLHNNVDGGRDRIVNATKTMEENK